MRLRALPPKVRAKIAQDDEGPVIADPVTTAMAVFDAFHEISSTVIELTDGARVPVLDAMSRTLFLSLDRRDRAINDVHTLAPPAPPEDLEAAAAQDADDAVTFDTVMPTLPVFLDDELQHIDGLQADATDLRPGGTPHPDQGAGAHRGHRGDDQRVLAPGHRGRAHTATPGGSSPSPAPRLPARIRMASPGHPDVERGPRGADRAPRSYERDSLLCPAAHGAVLPACSLPRRSSPATSR